MVELEWSGRGKSSVAGYGIVTSGTTLDVDEQTANRLLTHHSGGWSRVESESQSEDEIERPEDITADEIEEAFNLSEFLDEHWQTIVQTIDAGGIDTHLDDIEAAERERDSPRSSILEAIDMRRQARREGGES
jgi:hypothetical protein